MVRKTLRLTVTVSRFTMTEAGVIPTLFSSKQRTGNGYPYPSLCLGADSFPT